MNSKDKPTRKFMVINEKGEHEYNIVVSEETSYGRKYTFLASNNPIWNEPYRDKVLLTMTDTGNGFTFDRDVKTVGYDLGIYLKILLTFESKTFAASENKFKIIEENAILEV